MGGGVFGSKEVKLANTLSSVLSPDTPVTACTPVGQGTDEESGTTANGGGLGLQSRE